jgi:hypothetical protein
MKILTKSLLIFMISTSIHAAVDVRCLKVVNGKCVSINDMLINNTVNALVKIPETAGAMLFGHDNSQDLPAVPLKGSKSLSECMKGKNIIDNDVLNCRNGT